MRKGFLLILFLALMTLVSAATSSAQSRLTPEVALMRLCISEAGWECIDTGDGLAIHEVISRGSLRQEVSYTSFARAYAGRLLGSRPHSVSRLRWVGQLDARCREPHDWPRVVTTRGRDGTVQVRPHAPWGAFVERCRAVMAWAQEAIQAYPVATVDTWGPCAQAVHDWGGAMDRERARRLGLVRVSCGDTRNDFYARPSLIVGARNPTK